MRKRTVGGTLGDGPLAATAADANAVDNVALLGLVAETAGLVGARRARGAVDDVQLAELKLMHSQQSSTSDTKDFRLLATRSEREQSRAMELLIPPSSERGEGSAAHQTASSSEVPRRT